MDLILLILSTVAFIAAVVQAILALRANAWQGNRWHWVPMAVGLVLQTGFLYLRGQQHGRCPLTNLFEVLVFIGWGMVLAYFLVGTAYRLSLLGLFTAPLIALLQVVSLPLDRTAQAAARLPANPWLEVHAAVSLIAYAVFAMSCVTGVMYLVQARMLKQHRLMRLFFQLPPLHEMASALNRLTYLGLILLSVGLAASWPLNLPISNPKLVVAWVVWGLYFVVSFVIWRRLLSVHHTAWLAALAFAVPLVTLWIVTKA